MWAGVAIAISAVGVVPAAVGSEAQGEQVLLPAVETVGSGVYGQRFGLSVARAGEQVLVARPFSDDGGAIVIESGEWETRREPVNGASNDLLRALRHPCPIEE